MKTNNNNISGVSESFKEAVDNLGIEELRFALANLLLTPRTVPQFESSLRYAEKHRPDLYTSDTAENESSYSQPAEITRQTLHSQLYKLASNFTKRRVKFILEIVRCVYTQEEIEVATRTQKQPGRASTPPNLPPHIQAQQGYAGAEPAGPGGNALQIGSLVAGVTMIVGGLLCNESTIARDGLRLGGSFLVGVGVGSFLQKRCRPATQSNNAERKHNA